jgi:parallel beta-helix repeat protein/predicted outer membrane repeat protein
MKTANLTRIVLVSLVVLGLCGYSFAGQTIYVDDDGLADFNNIQAAIDDSSDGDTIIVADGTYTGAGNREISFRGKAITVRSENGPENCIIDCQGKGRGFYYGDGEDANSILAGLTITNGYTSAGGALYISSDSSPTIINCKFENNHSGGYGGAISCYSNYSPKLTNCIFTGNSSNYSGGGIFISEGSPILTNCTFSGNSAVDWGGAVHSEEISSLTIRNCLIIGNKTEWRSGGISITDGSRATVSNSILRGNSPDQIYEPFGTTVNHSDVQGGWPGSGNIDADPLFAAPGYWDANGLWVDGDYHLLPGSPCIDTGNPAYIPSPGETDIDGEPRVMGGRIDMGVDEFTSTPTPFIEISPTELMFYATQGSPNPKSQIISIRNIGSGTLNWEIAEDCPWLQVYPQNGESTGQVNEVTLSVDISGLDPGVYNCQLMITANEAANSPQKAAITLYLGAVLRVPSEYTTIQAAINAAEDNDTVLVADGTYTGTGNRDIDFHGKAITVRGENGRGKCIIDCKGTNDEPHRGFYLHSGEGRNSVVAGFTITNGYHSWGGGIFCSHASPAVTNCTFSNNSATEGGAIWIYDEGKGTTLTNCTFSRNSAGRNGGGIYIMDSSPILTNCTFSGNSAGVYGGAVAVRCEEISSPTIKNCLIIGNRAEDDGGGIFSSDDSYTIIENCTISDNSANDKGGGIYCHSGIMIVSNSILWGSSPDQIAPYYKPVINHSDVEGGWPGEGNIDIDPLFVDATGGNYHLLPGSPCIDAGDPNYVAEPNETDLDSNPRIMNGIVDMGAYEFQGPFKRHYHVDGVNGSDLNDGESRETAFATIQKGIDTATDGNSVLVYPAVYDEALLINNKAIRLQGVATSAGIPIIQKTGDYAVSYYVTEGPDSLLKNFVIRGSELGIFIVGGAPTIRNVTIVDNVFGIAGYADAQPDISNCILWNNTDGDLFGDPVPLETRYSFVEEEVNEPTLSGLVSHWKLDEGSGTTVYDSAGMNHGTIYGATWTTGIIDGALDFDGADDYVALPDNEPVWLPQNNFTLAAWVYPADYAGAKILDLNFTASANPDYDQGYAVGRNNNGQISFEMNTTTTTDENTRTNDALVTGRWYHIIALRNSTTQAIYLDGQLNVSRTCASAPIDFVGGYDDDRVSIGRVTTNIVNDLYFAGKIDEVRIYDRALSAGEINAIYKAGLAGISYGGPGFVDANGGDYHLLSERGRYWPAHDVWVLDDATSPCIDGGDPTIDPSNERMPNGGRINMGAYGDTAYASMSEWPIAEDNNRDGIVNMKDIAKVAARWLEKLDWVE